MKIRVSKIARRIDAGRRILSVAVVAVALSMNGAMAEPTGGALVDNSPLLRGVVGATIGSAANGGGGFDVTVTQNSARVVIDWADFNIDPNDVVHFDQDASNWIAVNRVTGGALTPTAIDGMLTGAGHIWILDPAGVAFGAGAVVDVGGLLATTSALDASTFVATDPASGTFIFTEDGTGPVTNAAALASQGLIALIAPVVENSNSLTSDNGDVLLGGANAFRLRFEERGRTPSGGGAVYQELLVTDFIIDTAVDNAVAPTETIPVTQTAAGSARGSNIIISAASVGGGAFLNVDGLVEATNVGTGSGSVMLLGGSDLVGGAAAATGTDILRTADLGIAATGALTVQASSVSIAASAQDIAVGSVALQAVTGDATINDDIVTTGAIDIAAAAGSVDIAALTAGTSIAVSGQDIDLAGKVTAGTTAMLTATDGDVSSTGAVEIEGSAVTVSGPVLAATDIRLTALSGAISSTDSLTATLGDIIANAPNGPITVNDLAAAGDIRLVGTSVNVTGTGTAQGSAFLQAVTGNVTVGGSVTASGGALVLDASNGSALLNRIAALSDVTLTVADLDLSGSISAGDQFILETERTGQTLVLGGDGTTGDVNLRRAAGLIIDESELTKISAGRFDIDGGANDVLLLDARLTASNLDTMMIGTDQNSHIIAAGTVSGLSSLQLGYQADGLDRRPDLIFISGQLGLDTATGRLGTVRLESADDIVIGTERFLEIFETDTLPLFGMGILPTSVVGGVRDHVFVATDQLQIAAPGSIVQLNTGRGADGAGLVFRVPANGDGVLFPSGEGPEEVLIFGNVIRADGTRVSSFNASLEENILFGGGSTSADPALTQNGQYFMNFCLIGDPVSCSADSLRELERNNRFMNGDPSGLGAVIPVVFETGENDERDEEEDLGGVAASGNEALWDAGSR